MKKDTTHLSLSEEQHLNKTIILLYNFLGVFAMNQRLHGNSTVLLKNPFKLSFSKINYR